MAGQRRASQQFQVPVQRTHSVSTPRTRIPIRTPSDHSSDSYSFSSSPGEEKPDLQDRIRLIDKDDGKNEMFDFDMDCQDQMKNENTAMRHFNSQEDLLDCSGNGVGGVQLESSISQDMDGQYSDVPVDSSPPLSQETVIREVDAELAQTDSISQDDTDLDVKGDNSPPLSQEAVVEKVDAVLVDMPDEPDGANSIIVIGYGSTYNVLTKNSGTSLRVMHKTLRNGREVFIPSAFPFPSTFVGSKP